MRQHELNPSDFPSSAINSQFSIKILKTSKKSVGFNSLFCNFYSGTFLKCFFMIATATTTILCQNYIQPHTFVHASLFLQFSSWKCCCLWTHKQIMKLHATFSNKSKLLNICFKLSPTPFLFVDCSYICPIFCYFVLYWFRIKIFFSQINYLN